MESSGFVLADHANHGRVFIVLLHPVAVAVAIAAVDGGRATSAVDGRHDGRRKLMDGRCRVIMSAVVMVTVAVKVIAVVVVDIVGADDDGRPAGTDGIIQRLRIRPLLLLLLLLLLDGSGGSLGVFPEPLHRERLAG